MNIPQAPAELKTLLSTARVITLEKGEALLHQGEEPVHAYVVKSGVIRVFDITTAGEEIVITFTDKLGFLPFECLFDKSKTTLFYASAFIKSEVYVVDKQELLDVLLTSKEMLRYTVDRYVNLYVGAKLHISALEQSKAAEKIVRLLEWLALRFGKEVRPNVLKIDLRLTHQDLAHMIGVTRETTAIELGKLRDENIIDYHNQRYTLNVTKAHKMLGPDDLKNLEI